MGSTPGRIQEEAGLHLMAGFGGTTFDEELKQIVRDFRVGGVVLFRRNITGPEQLKLLLDEAQDYARSVLGRGLLVAIDQEGGPVQRMAPPFTQLPSARSLASGGPDSIAEWAARAASDLKRMGIGINLAPVLDIVEGQSGSFMEERSLGADPERVGSLGALWIETLQNLGISATAKHYPGLGQAELDPHHFAPVIHWRDAAARDKDLLPFHTAVKAGVHCFMTSHALYPDLDPQWPATLSAVVNREWLRGRLGFGGVLFSDDMDMAAVCERYSREETVRQGMLASIDFFLLCQHSGNIPPFHEALARGIRDDAALAEAHRESLARVARLFRLHGIDVAG